MNYTFRTKDHPEANGRKPRHGEVAIRLFFPTEDGGRLDVLVGLKGFEDLREVMEQYSRDEMAGLFESGQVDPLE